MPGLENRFARFVPVHDGHAGWPAGGDERLERRVAIPTLILVEGHAGAILSNPSGAARVRVQGRLAWATATAAGLRTSPPML